MGRVRATGERVGRGEEFFFFLEKRGKAESFEERNPCVLSQLASSNQFPPTSTVSRQPSLEIEAPGVVKAI